MYVDGSDALFSSFHGWKDRERKRERGGEGETRIVGYFFSTPPAQKKLAAFALYFVERTRRERLSLFKRIPEIWSYRKENDECESF